MSQSDNEWNVPNWRDQLAYTSLLDSKWWRWEFLRRDPEYRKDWKYLTDSGKLPTGCEKYGIMFSFPNPRTERPSPFEFAIDLGFWNTDNPILRPGIDVSRDLESQFRRTNAEAKAYQKMMGIIPTRHHTEKWPLYLRALDARDTYKAKFREMGEILRGKDDYSDATSSGRSLYNSARKVQEDLLQINYDKEPGIFSVIVHGGRPEAAEGAQ